MANINTVALLLRDDIVTVQCAFDEQADKEYSFVCDKSLAAELELGDRVVIKGNRDYFQIVHVRQVDEDCDVDTSAAFNYGWVVSKVDTAQYEENVKKTEEVVAKLKKRQREATRKQALAAMGIMDAMELLEKELKKEK